MDRPGSSSVYILENIFGLKMECVFVQDWAAVGL